jgi:hypothetical protein
MQSQRWVGSALRVSIAVWAFVCIDTIHAATLGLDHLLVSTLRPPSGPSTVTEYTLSGSAIQSFSFPDFQNGFRELRDIAVDVDGTVQGFNGTFTPQLSMLVPSTGTITSRPFAGWSTASNDTYGGIGIFGTGVFVTDMATAGASEKGIVRFSTSGDPTVRFASRDYSDLTIGGDGLLYAIDDENNGHIDVYNPRNNGFVRTITTANVIASSNMRGIAVSSNGTLYIAAFGGTVFAADSSGAVINSRITGFNQLADIDLDNQGRLVVSNASGTVILTDTTLASQTSFTSTQFTTVHVAFTSPLIVPEPAQLLLLGLSCIGAARSRTRRGGLKGKD